MTQTLDQTNNNRKAQNPKSVVISWDRENFFPANAKHLHLCGFWPPWPHFRRKSDEEAGSSRDFHAISRLKGGSLIIHSLRFPNAKKKLLLSHAIFKGQQFDHMQSLHCRYLLTLHCQTMGSNCFWRKNFRLFFVWSGTGRFYQITVYKCEKETTSVTCNLYLYDCIVKLLTAWNYFWRRIPFSDFCWTK